ncbi:MAG: DUF1801 domain-containing protein [Planctomycetaceae bacterium]
MSGSVDEYMAALPDWQNQLAGELVEAVMQAAPSLTRSIKWGQPVFESNGPVCYFKGHKNHLTFGFWRGAALIEIDDRLESSGEKMAHMKLTEGSNLVKSKIKKLVKAAVELNRTLGNPTRKG